MASGTLLVHPPDTAEERAAGHALIGGRPLQPGHGRRIDLATLTATLAVRGPGITPGAVAAHVLGRTLAPGCVPGRPPNRPRLTWPPPSTPNSGRSSRRRAAPPLESWQACAGPVG